MLKEYLCDNHSQWNNSLVAMETQSPVNDKEKRTMYPRQPPRVLQTSDLMNSKTVILCVMLTGGLGNNIFQFASTFGIAMSKNMTFIVNRNSYLNYVFKLNVNFTNDYSVCKTFKVAIEKSFGTYDEKLLSYNSSQNLRIGHYLQSWKYSGLCQETYRFDTL
jgi:galactoside 2-L-fucosyltransferase 1/2